MMKNKQEKEQRQLLIIAHLQAQVEAQVVIQAEAQAIMGSDILLQTIM